MAALVQEVRTSFAELDKRVRQDHSEHTAAERKRRSERLAEGRAAREKRQAVRRRPLLPLSFAAGPTTWSACTPDSDLGFAT